MLVKYILYPDNNSFYLKACFRICFQTKDSKSVTIRNQIFMRSNNIFLSTFMETNSAKNVSNVFAIKAIQTSGKFTKLIHCYILIVKRTFDWISCPSSGWPKLREAGAGYVWREAKIWNTIMLNIDGCIFIHRQVLSTHGQFRNIDIFVDHFLNITTNCCRRWSWGYFKAIRVHLIDLSMKIFSKWFSLKGPPHRNTSLWKNYLCVERA